MKSGFIKFITIVFGLLIIILGRLIEFLVLAIVSFISFLSLRTPYEQLEEEIKEKGGSKTLSDLNIFRRFFSFFFFGLPMIYIGLKLTNLVPIELDYTKAQTFLQLLTTFISTLGKIKPFYYILVLIPFLITLIIKFQMEKVWYDLNKETMKLFNIRLIQFRNIKFVKELLKKSKKINEKKFRKVTLDIIKKSSIVWMVFGIFFMYLISSIFAVGKEYVFVYILPLGFAWFLVCIFLTIFEKTLCDFYHDVIEFLESLKWK